jgi:hypothetical protein
MIAPSTSQESRRYDYPANPAGHTQLHHAQGHDLSMSDNIKQWLEQLGLGQYSNAFAENEIGFGVLAELDQETLKELGVTAIGHRLAIIKAARGCNRIKSIKRRRRS